MTHPVFISYARTSSLSEAQALHEALGGNNGPSFLDSADIPPGSSIPQGVFEALLAARVVVVFTDSLYFTRPYCLEEFNVAMFAYETLLEEGASEEARTEAVAPVLVAMPAGSSQSAELQRFPPDVASTNWVRVDQTEALKTLIDYRLEDIAWTIGELLEDLGRVQVRDRRNDLSLPSPQNVRGTRSYLRGTPLSIGRRFVGQVVDLLRGLVIGGLE